MAGSIEIYDANGQLLKTVPLRDVTKIGSVDSAHVHLDDPSVSRMHAVIELDEGAYTIMDLGAGTFVNGRSIQKATLADGDNIHAGSAKMIVRLPDQPAGDRHRPPRDPGPKIGKTFWARVFDYTDLSSHTGRSELAPPPRSIPAALFAFFMLNGRTLVFPLLPIALLGVFALAGADAGQQLLARREIRLAAGVAVLAAIALWLAWRWTRLGLFSGGLNQRGKLVEKLTGVGGYESSTFNAWAGWSYSATNYTGPVYVSIVEITSPHGSTARLKFKGMAYQGEQILYDPRDPARNLRASRFGVRAAPDDDGQWQVRGHGRSLFLFALAGGALGVAIYTGIALLGGL